MAKGMKQKKDSINLGKVSVKLFAALCFSSALSACGGHMSSSVDTQIILPADASFADVAEADKIVLKQHKKAVHAVLAKSHHKHKAKKPAEIDAAKVSHDKWTIKHNAKGEVLYYPEKTAATKAVSKPVVPVTTNKIVKTEPKSVAPKIDEASKAKAESTKKIEEKPVIVPQQPTPKDAPAVYPPMPNKKIVPSVKPVEAVKAPKAKPVDTPKPIEASANRAKFDWPVHGKVTKEFLGTDQQTVRSINIAVPVGTPVRAAADGLVIYAGDGLKEFGNIVLIKHDNNFVTVYGNNSKLQVEHGKNVKKGDIIALSGDSGQEKKAGVHFEVRDNLKPVNPMDFLVAMPE